MTVARTLLSRFSLKQVARRWVWLTALVVVSLTTAGSAQRGPDVGVLKPPSGSAAPLPVRQPLAGQQNAGVLPPAAQAQISAAIGEDQSEYHAAARRRGVRMTNEGRKVSADFTAEGVTFRQGANHWAMTLRGYGYGDRLRKANTAAPKGRLNRVEYRRGALTEWYVNGPLGLEQGFTLERAPGNSNGEPLTLIFALSGNVTPSVDAAGRSLTLRKDGVQALRYSGLTAIDADGRELRAWLEVSRNRLRVRVDDAGARYPVTIDPYVQAATLTAAIPCDPANVCDDGAPGDELGHSVSISADASTIVVGAPYKYTNSVRTGAAYVFVKPGDFDGGWNSAQPIFFKAKLLASDGATNGLFLGYSVDISRDGGTIVLGAPSFASITRGAAYVFVRPSSGWGSITVQTQTAKLTADPMSAADVGSLGASVAIDGYGATIAVGAPHHKGDSPRNGAAYVFLRPPSGWVDASEFQKLVGTTGSYYGTSVALSDDASILVVGATGEDPFGGAPNDIGAAHLLSRHGTPGSGNSYTETTRLISSDGVPFDLFGHAVSADADGFTVVVGAPGDPDDTASPHGAVYVFEKPASGWPAAGTHIAETAKLATSDGNGDDELGVSVDISLDGSTIVAGTYWKAGSDRQSAAYFFLKPGASWLTATEDAKVLPPDGTVDDWFGYSTSLSWTGTVAAVGAPRTNIDANLFEGATYVFTGTGAAPSASVSPTSLTFGPQPVGTTSGPQIVTLTNTGAAPLHVTSVAVTGSFTATQNCLSASPIAPGTSCSESVTFAALSASLATGTLSFTDDSGGTSGAVQQVALQGDGQKANTSTTIAFVSANPVLPGQPVNVSVSVVPEAGGTVTPSGTVTVQANTGESCTMQVLSNACALVFSTPGDRTITAAYNGSDDFNPSTSTAVSVKVVDFSLSAAPSSQVLGRKTTYRLSVAAVNGFTGVVSLGCSGGPVNSTCAVSPASVSVSGSTAKAKVSLDVPPGAGAGTYTITFTGTYGGITRSTTASLVVK